MVLGLLFSKYAYADHNLNHFVVVDCDSEAISYNYNLNELKLEGPIVKQIKLRIKFNNKTLAVSPRDTFLRGINTIDFIYGINDFLKKTDKYLNQEFPKANKQLALKYRVYNFLDRLPGRKARITKKTNESVLAVIDKKSELWDFKEDERIVIYINRVDGTGHLSFYKVANDLTKKYYLTITDSKDEYSEIQRFRFFRCALAQAKF